MGVLVKLDKLTAIDASAHKKIGRETLGGASAVGRGVNTECSILEGRCPGVAKLITADEDNKKEKGGHTRSGGNHLDRFVSSTVPVHLLVIPSLSEIAFLNTITLHLSPLTPPLSPATYASYGCRSPYCVSLTALSAVNRP
ncbi:hypothetical protein J6590_072391 [Homalodisca vitripennis]|nr:hypothetical protein J6590_072391 [Homalodisca vitripennis]